MREKNVLFRISEHNDVLRNSYLLPLDCIITRLYFDTTHSKYLFPINVAGI